MRRLQLRCTDRHLVCLIGARPGHGPQRTIQEPVAGLANPTLAWQLITGRSERHGGGCDGRCGYDSPAVPRPCPASQTGHGSTVELRCGSDVAVPARLVGWSEPGNQAKGGDTW